MVAACGVMSLQGAILLPATSIVCCFGGVRCYLRPLNSFKGLVGMRDACSEPCPSRVPRASSRQLFVEALSLHPRQLVTVRRCSGRFAWLV
ncbi:hypothetical protein COO60DRAFT_1294419 [Scenedesmus sp. NREL 46B-D3]|nr:hypothetical protein COO60DRAFT_1294419 [Scenedesmus sp. NREL 46B-D3]